MAKKTDPFWTIALRLSIINSVTGRSAESCNRSPLVISRSCENCNMLEEPGTVWNWFVDGTQHNLVLLIGETCYQDFRNEIGDLLGLKVHHANNLSAHQGIRNIQMGKLRARLFDTHFTQINP